MNSQSRPLPVRAASRLVIVAGGLLVAVACAQDQAPKTGMDRGGDAAMEMRGDAAERKGMDQVAADSGSAVTGEVPDEMLDAVYAELEKTSGGRREDFELVRAEQAQWSDGALGCPEPGATYTDAPVSGYWVVLNYQGREYDSRGNARGFFRPCRTPTMPGRSGPKM